MATKPVAATVEKLKIFDLDGNPVKDIQLPPIFTTPIRKDIVRRAFLAASANMKQPKGQYEMAGKRTSAVSRGVGLGIARVPRLKTGDRAAFAPMTVKGRITQPTRVEKIISEGVNRKERRLALQSAVAATASPTLVRERGHQVAGAAQIPLIVVDEIQSIARTSQLYIFMAKVGLRPDIERVKYGISRRPGRGKFRGRTHKKGKGPLIVVAGDEGISRAARNLPGVEVAEVNSLTIRHLAPGSHVGRLTVWSESALTEVANRIGGAA